jgi:hypothetical protein
VVSGIQYTTVHTIDENGIDITSIVLCTSNPLNNERCGVRKLINFLIKDVYILELEFF